MVSPFIGVTDGVTFAMDRSDPNELGPTDKGGQLNGGEVVPHDSSRPVRHR
jgi:hypothetical protein